MNGHTRTVCISLQRKPVGYLREHITLHPTPHTHLIAYSSVFNDFGPKFTCIDPTGEQPLSGMIASIDKVNEAFTERRLSVHPVLLG